MKRFAALLLALCLLPLSGLAVHEAARGVYAKPAYLMGRVMLSLASDWLPLVEGEGAQGFVGYNGYGPVRLVVENTISAWVKGVAEIIIGEA